MTATSPKRSSSKAGSTQRQASRLDCLVPERLLKKSSQKTKKPFRPGKQKSPLKPKKTEKNFCKRRIETRASHNQLSLPKKKMHPSHKHPPIFSFFSPKPKSQTNRPKKKRRQRGQATADLLLHILRGGQLRLRVDLPRLRGPGRALGGQRYLVPKKNIGKSFFKKKYPPKEGWCLVVFQ